LLIYDRCGCEEYLYDMYVRFTMDWFAPFLLAWRVGMDGEVEIASTAGTCLCKTHFQHHQFYHYGH
jgi:hypothetical protein